MKQQVKVIKTQRDYDAAIAGDPKAPSSYYVRGLAKRALGDAPGGGAYLEGHFAKKGQKEKLS